MSDNISQDRQKPNNTPYVVAVVTMMFIAVVGSAIITVVEPKQDNTVIIAAIFGFLTPTTLSLLAFMKSQETHLSVNSRLDAFMKTAQDVALGKGLMEGRIQGKKEANERTDELAKNRRQNDTDNVSS
jgi:hypothetical protein